MLLGRTRIHAESVDETCLVTGFLIAVVQRRNGVLFLLAWLGLVEPAAVIGSNVVALGANHGPSVDLPCSRVTTVDQIYGWAPRRGDRRGRRGTGRPRTPGGGAYRRRSSGASQDSTTTRDAGNAYPVRSANANTAE